MKQGIQRIAAALLISAAFLAFAAPARLSAQSMALLNTLVQIQQLSNHDFNRLVKWSRNWAPEPPNPYNALQATEHSIRSLGSDDRNAVFFWLDGLGRASLYARGVNDAQIGPRDPGTSPAPTPTPNAWRNVPLATGTLDGSVQGPIQVLGGFAAARRDGTMVIACVSFQNNDPKTASEVVFQFPLMSSEGAQLGTLTLDRTGTFSSNIGIYSYNTMSDWQQNQPPSSRMQNCIRRDLGTAAIPVLEARYAGYRVTKVVYTDGTTWTPSSP